MMTRCGFQKGRCLTDFAIINVSAEVDNMFFEGAQPKVYQVQALEMSDIALPINVISMTAHAC